MRFPVFLFFKLSVYCQASYAWIPESLFPFSPRFINQVKAKLQIYATNYPQRRLGLYNVDNRFTVSGYSAGSSMSMILGLVFSDLIKGIGVFGHGSIGFVPSGVNNWLLIHDYVNVKKYIDQLERQGVIPTFDNFKTWDGAYVHCGFVEIFPIAACKIDAQLLRSYGVPKVKSLIGQTLSTHCIPTSGYFGEWEGKCNNFLRFVCGCGFCSVCDMLNTILPNYRPANLTGHPSGKVFRFPQNEFVEDGDSTAISLADYGWYYVPRRCEFGTGVKCELHFYLHGCGESTFTTSTGMIPHYMVSYSYMENADANDLIVVMPQVRHHVQNLSFGCWDFFSHTSLGEVTFWTPQGKQPKFFKRIYERITFGK